MTLADTEALEWLKSLMPCTCQPGCLAWIGPPTWYPK